MAIEFTESAGRHGFTQADAVHAISEHRYHEAAFDDPRLHRTTAELLRVSSRHLLSDSFR